MKKNCLIILIILGAGCGESPAYKRIPDPPEVKKFIKKPPLIREGFAFAGLAGKFEASQDVNSPAGWRFLPFEDVNDLRSVVKAGSVFEVLPSSTLEKMTAATDANGSLELRMWGQVCCFRDKNYVFPFYFVPVAENRLTADPNIPDPNRRPQREPIIPSDILEKLRPRKVVDLSRLDSTVELKADGIFADRSGYVVKLAEGRYVFQLDTLGLSVDRVNFELLPCEVLETAVRMSDEVSYKMRFSAAGILTAYNGKYYLLLQRAARLINYGNFSR